MSTVTTPASHVAPRPADSHGITSPSTSRVPSTRVELLDAIVAEHRRRRFALALQGARDAAERWTLDTTTKDLDLWTDDDGDATLAAVLATLGGVALSTSDQPGRLRHRTWGFVHHGVPAVVDVTVGDLRVGPVLLCPSTDIAITDRRTPRHGHLPALQGVALVSDLVVRPLLRGHLPDRARLDEGRLAWQILPVPARTRMLARLEGELGDRLAGRIAALLSGGDAGVHLTRQARLVLVRRTLRPAALGAAWHQRHTILPTRRPGPFGLPSKGALVVIIGTDGSGKSTVAEGAADALEGLGLSVTPAYLGMIRGNLPGVATARRLLTRPAHTAVENPGATAVPGTTGGSTSPEWARRAAAWYFAFEYIARTWALTPAVRRGQVVLCDRWVSDLRLHPWPGSRAAAVAERLTPAPHVLAHADAPAAMIHARKPERTVSDIAIQQLAMRTVLADHRHRSTPLVLDTSAAVEPTVAELIAATLRATHRATLRPT